MRLKPPSFRVSLFAGILLIMAAAVWMVFKPGGADALTAWKAAQEKQGEVFDLVTLTAAFSAEALAHEARFSNAVKRLVLRPSGPGEFDAMQAAGLGRARVAWQQPWPIEKRREITSWDEVAVQMATNAVVFGELRELLEHLPAGSARDYHQGIGVMAHPLILKRQAGQMLAAAVISDLRRGAVGEAREKIHTLLLLGRWHEDEGMLVDHMIRVALLSLATSVTWEALQAPGWNEVPLAALQADLEAASTWRKLPRTLAVERAFVLSGFEMARTNAPTATAWLPGSTRAAGSVAQSFNESIYTPIWQKAWSAQDELVYLKSIEMLFESYRDADRARSYQVFKLGIEQRARAMKARQGLFNRWRFPLSEVAQPAWAKAGLSLMRAESMREMARAATAIARHRLRHDAEPESLQAMVPEFLRDVPWDFMDGKPLRYRRHERRRFSLWSVGEDGRDDGGKGVGDDLIWPEPAAAGRTP